MTNRSTRPSPSPDAEVTQVRRAWERMHEYPPKTLYHYTTADGLLGMLEKREVWATHVRFMNDTSEMAHGIGVVGGALEEHSRRLKESDPKLWERFHTYEKWIWAVLEDSNKYTKHYLICFCANGNVLSQWRGYAAEGGGYALGFVTADLGRFAAEFLPESPWRSEQLPVLLRRVIYGLEEQHSIVSRCLHAVTSLAAYVRAHPDTPEPEVRFLQPVIRMLYECLVSFKHPAFSQEEEWRLIQQGRVGDTDVCTENFRGKSGRIVPFTPLKYRADQGEGGSPKAKSRHFPISTITYGPTLDPEASERALRLLVGKYGFAEEQITIEPSGIPFRT